MLLVDTSVWSDHLRRHDAALAAALDEEEVLTHPFVIGELACGVFPHRDQALTELLRLPKSPLLAQAEWLGFVERQALAGTDIGFVDIHLLASARVAGARLWTRDRRLAAAATRLGVGV